MASDDLKQIKKGVVKRSMRREIGLFIDGTALDRATRRLKRRVDMANLVRGCCSGSVPVVSRYYTLIPYEDDARQHAFLDALAKADLAVVTKRLPPKGVTRHVTVESEMATDIIAFAMGHTKFGELNRYLPNQLVQEFEKIRGSHQQPSEEAPPPEDNREVKRVVIVVCPSRDLAYTISLAGELGADTVTCDFGEFAGHDVLKSAAKWIDLSDSETIWRN